MSARSDMERIVLRIEAKNRELFVAVCALVLASIAFGSEITGAPGQPVLTGALRASWILEFVSQTLARITTNLVYARGIEDGVGPYGPLTLRSSVGGFHSIELTRTGFPRIVAHVTRTVTP